MGKPGKGYEAYIGFGEESVYGTKVLATKFLELISDGIATADDRIHSESLNGVNTDEIEVANGAIKPSGDFAFECPQEGAEMLFKHALGRDEITIDATNNQFDFNIGAGELTAAIAVGVYPIGVIQTDAGSFCEALYNAIIIAETAGTYTVTFDVITRKFTITRSAGTLELMWESGTNGSSGLGLNPSAIMGFDDVADDTGALTYTGDNAYVMPDSTEQASFVVNSENEKIDFNIGAGELNATVANGTYAMGLNHLDSGTLCEAIYNAIVAAEAAGTYTVLFNNSTKKITITRSAGTFELMWKTGTNGSDGNDTHIGTLIGFSDSADDTGAVTYTGDSAVTLVYQHVIKIKDELPTSLSLEINRGYKAFYPTGMKIDKFEMSAELNSFLKVTCGVIGREVLFCSKTTETLPSVAPFNYTHGAFTYNNSSTNVKNISFSLNNNLNKDRFFIGSRYTSEPTRAGKLEVTGKFTVEFDSTDLYDDFRAATSRALVLLFTGGTISGKTQSYTLQIDMPAIKLTGGVPMATEAGIILYDCPFKAYKSGSDKEFKITIVNTVISI